MPRSVPQCVSITIKPVSGEEPDRFEVAFVGMDGSEESGQSLALPAGKVGTWEITTTAAEPVAAGGGFLFQRHSFLFSHRIQDYNPQGRHFADAFPHEFSGGQQQRVAIARALASASQMDPQARSERIIPEGEVPSPMNLPSGCPFHPRCPHRMARCSEESPALKEIEPGYRAACFLTDGA